jgi:hypothetical protein
MFNNPPVLVKVPSTVSIEDLVRLPLPTLTPPSPKELYVPLVRLPLIVIWLPPLALP